jgi:hypothetical protein
MKWREIISPNAKTCGCVVSTRQADVLHKVTDKRQTVSTTPGQVCTLRSEAASKGPELNPVS